MTRSSQAKHSPQTTKKALKRTCLAAGMSHSDAVKISSSAIPGPKVSATIRRNPGRMDGVQWKADSFICPKHVDDGFDSIDEDSSSEEEEEVASERVEHVVSLLDIAKPAKPKGIAKEFEVVKRVKEIIFLDDDWETFSQMEGEWEEWEEIYEPTAVKEQNKPSYSAILQNKR